MHELAREAARRTGKTQTGVIELALERLLAQTAPPRGGGSRIDVVLSRIDATITDEMRTSLSTDELYDGSGLPR